MCKTSRVSSAASGVTMIRGARTVASGDRQLFMTDKAAVNVNGFWTCEANPPESLDNGYLMLAIAQMPDIKFTTTSSQKLPARKALTGIKSAHASIPFVFHHFFSSNPYLFLPDRQPGFSLTH